MPRIFHALKAGVRGPFGVELHEYAQPSPL